MVKNLDRLICTMLAILWIAYEKSRCATSLPCDGIVINDGELWMCLLESDFQLGKVSKSNIRFQRVWIGIFCTENAWNIEKMSRSKE